MHRQRYIRIVSVMALIAGLFAAILSAKDNSLAAPRQLAAAAPPLSPSVDWREWDSFLTHVVKQIGQDLAVPARARLGEVFFDARYQLGRIVAFGASPPVAQLFSATWTRLAPLLKQSISGVSQESAARISSFVAAMDAVTSLTELGQQLGLAPVTSESLRTAANLLGPADTDPLAYTLDVDPGLRRLLGFTAALPAPTPSRSLEQGKLPPRPPVTLSAGWRILWGAPSAHAAVADYSKLNEWVPERRDLEDYLEQVHELLVDIQHTLLKEAELAREFHALSRAALLATAWQESCWRQFVKKGQKLAPLRSATGDVGLMQVNRHVWRGFYDQRGLAGDIRYNGFAGAEILMHYLTRYALANNEHRQPGGHLARAAYAAYNGGPGHLSRYRSKNNAPDLKRVDDSFWQKFKIIWSGRQLAVKSCFGVL